MRHERFPDTHTAELVDPQVGLPPVLAIMPPLADLVRLLALQAAHEGHAEHQSDAVRQHSSKEG